MYFLFTYGPRREHSTQHVMETEAFGLITADSIEEASDIAHRNMPQDMKDKGYDCGWGEVTGDTSIFMKLKTGECVAMT